MDFNFTVTDIRHVHRVNERKFPNHKAIYGTNLVYNEIIYRPAGHATVTIDDTVLHTRPGSVFVIPAGHYSRYNVEFQEPDIFIDIFFASDRPIAAAPELLASEEIKSLDSLFKKCDSVWIRGNLHAKLECLSILYKILAELQKTNRFSQDKDSKIAPAVAYIEEHFLQESISCDKLATLCGIHYSYLERLFREKFNTSPKKYIIQLKMKYACSLLESGKYSITQVADALSYSDLYFFSRQFKKYVGTTPSDYLKKSKYP